MSDEDAQTDELFALSSIYDESTFTSQTNADQLSSGTLKAAVELGRLLTVTLAGKGQCCCPWFLALRCLSSRKMLSPWFWPWP